MNTRSMHSRFFALEVVAAAVLLPGAMTIPALAADPLVASDALSDAAPPVLPEDASTPTALGNDIDDQKVTVRIKLALVGDESLAEQYAGTRQVVDQLLVRDM
jgi:hypothetical protein